MIDQQLERLRHAGIGVGRRRGLHRLLRPLLVLQLLRRRLSRLSALPLRTLTALLLLRALLLSLLCALRLALSSGARLPAATSTSTTTSAAAVVAGRRRAKD